MQPIIQIRNLSKRFGKNAVLSKLDLDVYPGEILGIIGLSGSGKTTLLNTLIGYLEPEEGEISFYSLKDNKYKNLNKNLNEMRSTFGFATQNPSFYPKLTVNENLDHFATLYNLSKEIRQKNIKNLLELTSLTYAKDVLAQNLSGGMEKKLELSCSIVHKPKVLIMDEPTADLDPIARKEAWQFIRGIKNIGTTIILASHFIEELESICDRIAILHNKQIVAIGTPIQLRNIYAKNEEIIVETYPGDYNSIARTLSRYNNLNISTILVRNGKLVIYAQNSEEILHQIMHIIESMKENMINIQVNKPSLEEVFEMLAKNKN